MRLVEPYNGDQASDSILKIVVPGDAAGDCVARFEVTPAKYWDIRLDNDNSDKLIFGYAGGTSMTLDSSGGNVRVPSFGVGGSTSVGDLFTVVDSQNAQVQTRVRNNFDGTLAYAMVGVNASGNSWGMRMGAMSANNNALEFVVDAFGSPIVRLSLTTDGTLSIPTVNLTASKGTGTFTPVLGSFSPASSLQPTWLKASWQGTAGYIPFYPA